MKKDSVVILKFVSRLKCPTCNDARTGQCCSCECELHGTAELEKCPFASEIYNDESLHLLCDSCSYERSQDV